MPTTNQTMELVGFYEKKERVVVLQANKTSWTQLEEDKVSYGKDKMGMFIIQVEHIQQKALKVKGEELSPREIITLLGNFQNIFEKPEVWLPYREHDLWKQAIQHIEAGLAKEAFLWSKHVKMRGIFPDDVTMNIIVSVLKDGEEFDRAGKFNRNRCDWQAKFNKLEVNSMVDSADGCGTSPISYKRFLPAELFKAGGRMKELAAIDNGFSSRNPWLYDAAKVFGEVLRSGVAIDVITFNTMMLTCGSHALLSEAEARLDEMEKREISPDTKTYNIFMSLYADAGEINSALDCYGKIRKVYMDRGLSNNAKVLIESVTKDHLPTSRVCTTLRDIFADKGLWTEAENIFFLKCDSPGQKKDVLKYNVMIKAYGKAKLYEKAVSLHIQMKNQGTWLDWCTYNFLIPMLAGGDLPEEARDFLIGMPKVRYRPLCRTFSAVIACHARLGQLVDATDVLNEMEKAGVKTNKVVNGYLINGFAGSGRAEEASPYFQWMEEYGIPTSKVVLTSLIKAYGKLGCVEGDKFIYRRMMRMEGGADVVALNNMINLYVDFDMLPEAKLIFNGSIEENITGAVSLATMMFLYKSTGMLDETIEVDEDTKQTGLLKDCIFYNKVIACYITLLVSSLKRSEGEGQRTSSVLLILEKEKKFPEYILGRKGVKWAGRQLLNHTLEDKGVVEGRDLLRGISGQKGNEGNAAGGEGLKAVAGQARQLEARQGQKTMHSKPITPISHYQKEGQVEVNQ